MDTTKSTPSMVAQRGGYNKIYSLNGGTKIEGGMQWDL